MKAWVSLLLLLAPLAQAQDINALDPTKIYDTNNLATFNQNGSQTTTPWQNVGQWGGQITCWAPGDPGYCGPQPYVNAFGQGSINFSYGLTDLYQVASVASALPNSGTGLRVNGYNFGFTAKNGNGWDNGQVDYLTAYVTLYGSDSQPVRNDIYDLNYKFSWTDFSFSKTFDNPYLGQDLTTVRYGFIGGDSNFWAGPYGPEVTNVSFSLKYSVDPCYVNVLSSTSCPGYMEELARLTAVSDPMSESVTTSPSIMQDALEPPVTAAPAVASSIMMDPPAAANDTGTKPLAESAPSPSTASVLAMIQARQSREQTMALAAVEQSNQVAQDAVRQAEQIAMDTAAESQTQSQESAQGPGVAVSSSISAANTSGITLMSSLSAPTAPSPTSASSISVDNARRILEPSAPGLRSMSLPDIPTQSQLASLLPPAPAAQFSNRPTETIAPVWRSEPKLTEGAPTQIAVPDNTITIDTKLPTAPMVAGAPDVAVTPSTLFTRRGDPLSDYIEQNSIMMAMTQNETKSTTVKKDVQDNALAAGTDIANLARTPAGFGLYSLVLRDVAFYEPREIYKNVVMRDNVRTMYFIEKGNTDTYNRMVEEQYQ